VRTLYLVRWRAECLLVGPDDPPHRLPPPVLQAFANREAAEAFRADRERGLPVPPVDFNPLRYVRDLGRVTSLDEPRLRDWLMDAGLTPPEPPAPRLPTVLDAVLHWFRPAAPDHSYWEAWWDDQSPRWTDSQRQHVWQALDRVPRFAVVEVEWDLAPVAGRMPWMTRP
jgi:hypothetical protein